MCSRVIVAATLALLLALVAAQTARYWRYFALFMGDHGWYLQVAARVSQGEVLYRDVAWAYGPLPAQALAALFCTLGPDAALATLVNGLLAAASLLLTYAAVRSLLQPTDALLVTAFAALAGSYVGGDLIRLHLAAYTQGVSWGMMTSLAALVAALRWHQTHRPLWMAAAGVLVGLAFLSKLEFGVSAAGAVVAVLVSSRAAGRIWGSWLAGASLTLAVGFGWQASASGWPALWRGYTGYDMLVRGNYWGSDLAPRRWLASIVSFWLALVLLWVGWRWSRWRHLCNVGAALSLGLTLVVIAPNLLPPQSPESSAGIDWRWVFVLSLQWLAALPWGLLTPMLIIAAWVGRKQHAPPPWWGLWAFALLTNLRLALTGYSSGLVIAPALALFGWLLAARSTAQAASAAPEERTMRWRRAALAILVVLAATSSLAQALTSDVAHGSDRRWLSTSLGDIALPESPRVAEMVAIQADLKQRLPAGAGIFATGWGAGWYLLSSRANPTPFDVVLDGLGTSGAEAGRLQETLLRQPPAVVIVPTELWSTASPNSRRGRSLHLALRSDLALWWDRLSQDYRAEPMSDSAKWVVLWRR